MGTDLPSAPHGAEPGCRLALGQGAGAASHTQTGPGLHLWNLSSLGTTSEPSPREDAGLMGSLLGRGCADTGAGQAPGRQGPTESRHLTALTLRYLHEPRPAASSQLLQVLSWGGRGLYGYRSQYYQRRDVIKTRFPHQKSWLLSSTFTEGKWPRTAAPARGRWSLPCRPTEAAPRPPTPHPPPEQAECALM